MALIYCSVLIHGLLGADYMTSFSPVSRAEISARRPKQISLKKDVCDYMKRVSARSNGLKSHVVAFKFQPRLKDEAGHAQSLLVPI